MGEWTEVIFNFSLTSLQGGLLLLCLARNLKNVSTHSVFVFWF